MNESAPSQLAKRVTVTPQGQSDAIVIVLCLLEVKKNQKKTPIGGYCPPSKMNVRSVGAPDGM